MVVDPPPITLIDTSLPKTSTPVGKCLKTRDTNLGKFHQKNENDQHRHEQAGEHDEKTPAAFSSPLRDCVHDLAHAINLSSSQTR